MIQQFSSTFTRDPPSKTVVTESTQDSLDTLPVAQNLLLLGLYRILPYNQGYNQGVITYCFGNVCGHRHPKP